MRAEITMPSLTRLTLGLIGEAYMSSSRLGENLVIDLSNSSLLRETKIELGGSVWKQ
jgi:hypothetical protein